MGKRNLFVGYNLTNESSQMAVYNSMTFEPEFVGASEHNPEGVFETALYMGEDQEVVRNFVEKAIKDEEIIVDGKAVEAVKVFAFFFRKSLSLVKQVYPTDAIRQLVITVEDNPVNFVTMLYEALERLGIGRDRAMVISHKQSYLYYALCQKKELWLNDVGMFDYTDKGLIYYQMNIDRRKKPILVGVTQKDYSEEMQQEDIEQAKRLENITMSAIHRQIISTLYMNGSGFDGQWCDEVLQKLCTGRRVFKGKNLYVSGACYAARELSGEGKLEDFVFLDEDMIRVQITLKAYSDAKLQDITLAKAGTPWYQENREIDLIPDEEDELTLTVNNIMKHETRDLIIPLEGTRGRGRKLSRVGVRISFTDVNTCVVTLKDKGFGDFAPASNRIWERTISLT